MKGPSPADTLPNVSLPVKSLAKLRRLLRFMAIVSALSGSVAMQQDRVAAAGTNDPATTPILLRVHVMGLHNDKGNVRCSLFSSAEGFPADTDQRATTIVAPISNRNATCEFAGIGPGVYAIVLFHDENADGSFNRNWIGLPQEGYGFSNDARAYFRPPSFKDASFSLDQGIRDIRIDIHY
jgi:uncharacterized protein (DUF2141 family)